MNERQRTGRPGVPENDADGEEDSARLDEVRALADRMTARAQRSLENLGLATSNDFLNATRQSGGQ